VNFGMLLKSYSDDFTLATRLVESFRTHNVDNIALYCVVPAKDVDAFSTLASSTVHIMSEDDFRVHLTDEGFDGIRPGYINQEVIKLAFWEKGLVDNYFCVDSDAVFIRNFTVDDFIHPDGYPYTVLVEDRELLTDPDYYTKYWQSRESALRRIAESVGWQSPLIRTCHGHQIFNSSVLHHWKSDFLQPRGWSYLDALRVAPYEFSWYNLWLQSHPTIPIHTREPFVKVFHTPHQHLESILNGITEEDLARGYLAVVINSNYARDIKTVALSASKTAALAPYLSYGELTRILGAKAKNSLKRIAGGTD